MRKEDQRSALNKSGKSADIVDEVRKLFLDEKEEIQFLLDKDLVEAWRAEIHKNYMATYKEGKLKTPRDMNEFSRMLKK